MSAFNLVTQANTDPELEKVQDYEAPELPRSPMRST